MKGDNGTEIIVSAGSNIQLGVKRGVSGVFNPLSEVLYHKETTNNGEQIFKRSGKDGTMRLHQEFGFDYYGGVNFKRVFETNDEYGHMDGMYKTDNKEVTVSFVGVAIKIKWGTGGTSLFYGLNVGAGIGIGIGGSAETYHGNVIKF